MHALAIGHAGPDAAAAVNGLWNAGYHSIMRVEEAGEAAAAIACFHPELIFVLPDVAQSDSIASLRDIAKKADAPVVVACTGTERALDCLGPMVSSAGLVGRRIVGLPIFRLQPDPTFFRGMRINADGGCAQTGLIGSR